MIFSKGGLYSPRLELGETLTAALITTSSFTYDSYIKTVRREVGDGFERRSAKLLEVVDLAHQDVLFM